MRSGSTAVTQERNAPASGPMIPTRARLAVGLLLLAANATGWAAMPAGTYINNTTAVSYTKDGRPQSKVAQVSVEARGVSDSVQSGASFKAGTTRLYAGDTLAFDIDLANSGDNALGGGELYVTGPTGSTLAVAGLVLKATTSAKPRAAGTTQASATYAVPDLQPYETLNLSAQLTAPTGAATGTVSVEYHANGKVFTVAQANIEILNRSSASLDLLQYDASGAAADYSVRPTAYDLGGGSYASVAAAAVPGNSGVMVTDQPLSLTPGTTFSHDQPLFLRVSDTDQNKDPAAIDQVTLTLAVTGGSETETLRLDETDVNSGEFVGYIGLSTAVAAANDGVLNITPDTHLSVAYTDSVDVSDKVQATVLVDPFGRVFDSVSGALLDGFTVKLVNAATGADAVVYGDDGVSVFPATLVSGGSTTDSGGNTYDFAAGSYRFPFVAPGTYQLVVTPPAGAAYRSPSVKSDEELAAVPGGPFAIDLGSRGEVFTVQAGPPLRLDLPADPVPNALYVIRRAGKDRVAPGDFLPFEVVVENVSQVNTVTGVTLVDSLPHGFRYREGSVTLDGASIAEPTIGVNSGETLGISLGDLAPGVSVTVRYVTEVGAVRTDKAQSSSQAFGNAGTVASNLTSVSTTVTEDLFASHDVLMGRVTFTGSDVGVAGVRVFMEDGRYAVTDGQGRYHFEGVTAATHVVQLDLVTLPPQYRVVAADNTRSAGQPWSRFVDLQGGSLWREDFQLERTSAGSIAAVVDASPGNQTGPAQNWVEGAGPMVVELLADRSTLVADGINAPAVALRILDATGKPVPAGVSGEFRVDSPYQALAQTPYTTANLPGAPVETHTYVVGEDGVAQLRLQPTVQAGEARVSVPLADGRIARIAVPLKPKVRDWVLVGLAEGTAGYNALSGHTEPLQGNAAQENLYADGRIAFFAKGRVKGEWLLTIAYDSDKKKPARPSLFGTIAPGTYYTVYADESGQGYEATSSKKLYVKMERDTFYALYGDFDTDLRATELSRYSRSLTGLKSRYRDERFEVVAFASESNQAFVRDEIRGQGITGPYTLSRDSIVMNGEQVTLEIHDRLTGELVSATTLTRYIDYDINYDQGTLVFREPVFSTDGQLNPVFIVVKYESFSNLDQNLTYGGRAAARITKALGVGVTHVQEGRTGGDATLTGVDAVLDLGKQTQARVEVARSVGQDLAGANTGNAYLAELAHRSAKVNGRAYLRSQDDGFGLGQANTAESGTRSIGAEANLRPLSWLGLSGQAYRRDITMTGARRYLAEGQGRLFFGHGDLRLGGRAVRDRLGDGSPKNSNQITAGASQRFFHDRLNLRVDREQSIGAAESVDFPTRTRVGGDYLLNARTSLFAEEELTNGEVRDTSNTRVGLKTRPWSGADVTTALNRQQSGTAQQTSAVLGLHQRLIVSEAWSLDLGAEQSKLLSSEAGIPLDTNVPFASGPSNGDFTAASVGATYNPGPWLWTARIEGRDGATENSIRLATSAQTEPRADVGLLTSATVFVSDPGTGKLRENINLGLGFAYRPAASRWLALNKTEFIVDKQNTGVFEQNNWRVVNNFNANYRAGKWQLAPQYGAKYVVDTIDGIAYRGVLQLVGLEGRYDLTKRWDMGAQSSVLHSLKTGQFDYSAGVSVGHSFVKNMWLSLGYNVTGFNDTDLSSDRYTSQGPYLKFRMKFDQQTVREILRNASAAIPAVSTGEQG